MTKTFVSVFQTLRISMYVYMRCNLPKNHISAMGMNDSTLLLYMPDNFLSERNLIAPLNSSCSISNNYLTAEITIQILQKGVKAAQNFCNSYFLSSPVMYMIK